MYDDQEKSVRLPSEIRTNWDGLLAVVHSFGRILANMHRMKPEVVINLQTFLLLTFVFHFLQYFAELLNNFKSNKLSGTNKTKQSPAKIIILSTINIAIKILLHHKPLWKNMKWFRKKVVRTLKDTQSVCLIGSQTLWASDFRVLWIVHFFELFLAWK